MTILTPMAKYVYNLSYRLHLPVTDKYSGSLHLLGTYIESIGSILWKLGYCEQSQFEADRVKKCVELSEELCILLASFFPDLTDKYKEHCHISFVKLANSLFSQHHKYFQQFVENTVPRILISLMATPTSEELDILIQSYNKSHSNEEIKKSAKSQLGLKGIKSYIEFWTSIFDSNFDGKI